VAKTAARDKACGGAETYGEKRGMAHRRGLRNAQNGVVKRQRQIAARWRRWRRAACACCGVSAARSIMLPAACSAPAHL